MKLNFADTLLILFAVFIDLLQAVISMALSVIALFPGTIGGGAAGCIAGNAAAGKVGCLALGFLGGLIGTIIDPALAPFTEPIGIALGFAVDICISATFGVLLVLFLAHNGMAPKSSKSMLSALLELIPGLDNLPGWTTMTVICVLEKRVAGKVQGSGIANVAKAAAFLFPEEGIAAKALSTVGTIASGVNRLQASQQETKQRSAPLMNDIQTPRKIAAVALILLFGTFGGTVHAQSLGGQPAPVQYIVAPETPGPNAPVNISVEGVGNFLGDATITWEQNGKVASSGTGDESFTFTTGAVGTHTSIHVVIDSPTQGTITNDFTFYPSVINLLWEADTSAPPFYAGKTLYSAGSPLTVVAFPIVMSGSSLVAASKLSYQWSLNGTPNTGSSGLGRSSFSFSGSGIGGAQSVSVDVLYGATKVGHADISIPATNPEIVLYDQDPLRGEIFDSALTSPFSLTAPEITVKAEPYFFANDSLSGTLGYNWTLNGQPASGPSSAQGLLTLRQTGQGGGSAQISVSLQNSNADQYLQSASAALELLFGQQQNSSSSYSSFFGL